MSWALHDPGVCKQTQNGKCQIFNVRDIDMRNSKKGEKGEY